MITPDSPLLGNAAGQLKLFDRYAVNLLALSRKGRRITRRLRSVKLRAGDVVVFRGNLAAMPETLGEGGKAEATCDSQAASSLPV